MKTPSIHHVLGRLVLIFPLLLKISVAGYHHFDNHKRRWFAIWLFLFLAGGWFQAMAFYSYAEAAEPSGRGTAREEILILNSYHPGYAWSEDEQAGIIDVFRGKDKNWLPVIEYLDLLRLPDGRHLAELKQLFRRKYQNQKFSVVIAMDNPALEFAIDNQSELFRNVPIVFCGINNYTPSMLKGHTNVTGIAETLDQAGTIELMLRLHPKTREILLIHDYTVTGLEARKEIEALAPRFAAQVRFRFLDRLSMDEVLKEFGGLPKGSLVLFRLFITDKTGHTFELAEVAQLVTKHSPVPVYSTHEYRLGLGIVGGKLLRARIHGANAARIALRVLAGEKASAIPVVLESDAQFMFDYKVMSRFGITLSALPKGSTVINKPVSFCVAHRPAIQTALVVIGILTMVIFLLTVIIIQRRRSVILLRASEAKYYDLYENAPNMYLSVDAKTATIMECNNTLVHTIGYAKEEILGRSIFEIYHPDCKEDAKRVFQQFSTTGEVRDAELKIRRKDGSIIDVSLNASAVRDKEGKITHSRSIWRDITASKQAEEALCKSEERYRILFQKSPVSLWEEDFSAVKAHIDRLQAEGVKDFRAYFTSHPEATRRCAQMVKTSDINEATLRIYGARSKEELLYNIGRVFTEESYDTFREELIALAEGKTMFESEAITQTLAGARNHIFLVWSVVPGHEESLSKVLVSITDITEGKRAEEELSRYRQHLEELIKERTVDLMQAQDALTNLVDDLNKKTNELVLANERLKELDRLKSMFIASMSHELRTPLNSIIGFTGILLQGMAGELNDEQQDQLRRVQASGKHLLDLISDVIDISKIEAGKLQAYVSEFSLATVIDQAVANLKREIARKGLDLEIAFPDDVTLNTDRRRLLQCVLNLLSNAVKYTEKGGVRLSARTISEFGLRNSELKGEKYSAIRIPQSAIEISVADTGIGIREEDLPLLFAPFTRLESPLKVKNPGTGLGLYLTKKIAVELLGGSVVAQSKPGVGSTFTLIIPKNLSGGEIK